MAKKVVKKKESVKKQVKSSISAATIGAGLAAVAAAAAGTYFLYGAKHAAKNRKQVKAWSLKARGEVLEQLEKLSAIDEKVYHKVIKEVASKYKALQRLSPKDVTEFVGELKGHWNDIAKEVAHAAAPRKAKSLKRK